MNWMQLSEYEGKHVRIKGSSADGTPICSEGILVRASYSIPYGACVSYIIVVSPANQSDVYVGPIRNNTVKIEHLEGKDDAKKSCKDS